MRESETISAESPLWRLYHRKHGKGSGYINAEQLAAGEKLRQDFERAQLQCRVVSSYAEASGSGGRHWQVSDNAIENISLGAIDARDRLQSAFEAVGPELSGILYQVCCLAAGFEAAEAVLNLPVRSGKAVIALALTRLARHYGFVKLHRPKNRSLISHWAMDDYRPQIMPREE
ncbi:DUF6456 domain-containing protein [Aestuariivirga litoralis]|uniref:DUF6456 domain-containing protein n=1 Tax=Aestuariivirga litoralis TaxID=2650924 RepID=UPI0018C62560|nr:DUF6456 domain-containing protein [Aestuariivirga litoralis]MBG1232472.1 DNA replication protein [Aestuariivirga litoralis]